MILEGFREATEVMKGLMNSSSEQTRVDAVNPFLKLI